MNSLFSQYGFFGFCRLIRDVIFTKALFSFRARLVRYPFYIRGKKYFSFGESFTSGVGLRIDVFPGLSDFPSVTIGDRVQINDYVHIAATNSVKIGNDVLIASKVFITDHNHGRYSGDFQDDPRIPPASRNLVFAPVTIDDNVWIGELVSILPGVIIGKGAIIGANSVVNSNIPEYSIAAGVPARVIKIYDFESSKWIRINQR